MDNFVLKLKKLDKRWIYLMIFIAIMLPFFPGFEFLVQDFSVTKETQMCYDELDKLNAGDAIYLDFAFDPTTQAELLPMVEQTFKQALDKKLRIFMYYPFIQAIALGENLVAKVKKDPKYSYIEEGVNYVHLGYLPLNTDLLMFSMYSDFKGTFGKEGKIFDGIKTFDDINVLFSYSGSAFPMSYLLLQRRFGFRMAIGCTAVMGPDYIPYLQTGQLKGMLFGLKGAAEYEKLRNDKGAANRGMASLTLAHLVMFLFIGIGNFIYIYESRKKKGRG